MTTLARYREAAEAARETFAAARITFNKADAAYNLAAGAARDERIQKGLGPFGGAPRRAASSAPLPPSALEVAAEAARKKRDVAENSFLAAQVASQVADADYLAQANRRLNRPRLALAMAIQKLESDGAPPEVLEPMRAQLRAICPDDRAVAINQRCTYPSLAMVVLAQAQDVLQIHTPCNVLNGINHEYATWRAETLAAAEREEAKLEAAQAVA